MEAEEPTPDDWGGRCDRCAGVSAGAQAGALIAFVVLGTLAPAAPLALSLFLRERSVGVLRGLRGWMMRENATIVAVLCLVFAAKLLGDALSA